jgi:predicted nucleic acid-binding protein
MLRIIKEGRRRNHLIMTMPNPQPRRAYLDNNIVSAIAKDDEPAESDALDRLLKAMEEGKVDLVTSELTMQEIKRYQGPRSVERTFRLLPKVKVVRWDELVGMHSYGDARTWITTPLIENDPDYSALLALGLEIADAQHVFVAAKQACGAFLTCDGGILHRVRDIQKRFGLIVQRPSVFVASQPW